MALEAECQPPVQPWVPSGSLWKSLKRISVTRLASSTTLLCRAANICARDVRLYVKWSPYRRTSAVWFDSSNSSGS